VAPLSAMIEFPLVMELMLACVSMPPPIAAVLSATVTLLSVTVEFRLQMPPP